MFHAPDLAPQTTRQPVSQLSRYLNAGFAGELEIHLRQTAHYHRVFFFLKIKLTYYLIAPKTTKKNKMAIKLRA